MSSKKILQNTFFLYIRMFLVLGVSLYTSRIILNTLGVEDYGIYSLIAGVVVMFTFLNNALNSTIQRFFNVQLADKNIENLSRVFSASIMVQVFITVIFVALAETIGLWFLNQKLTIPDDRISAANYVYQFTILLTIINFLKIPFNALIIAYERMKFFALISILEVVLKLILVFSLTYFMGDKLIIYALLLSGLSFFILVFNVSYTNVKFKNDISFTRIKDRILFKEMASFSGWSLFGNMALLGSNQGVAIILNLFLGVFINATMGIANQINAALYTFVSNLQIAFKPQAIQSYASGRKIEHLRFLLQTSKASYYLLLVLVTPLLINMEQVLFIWLGEIPKYTVEFSKLILILALIDALSGPFWMSANAIGNIRDYQIMLSVILLLNLPIAYLILYSGFSPIYVMLGKVVLSLLSYFYRIQYVIKKIKLTPDNFKTYIIKIIGTTFFSSMLYFFATSYFNINRGVIYLIINSVLNSLILLSFIWFIGIDKNERDFVIKFLKRTVSK